MESLHLLEPFGNENPSPILFSTATQIWPPKVVGKYHLKLFLEQGDRMLEGIAFGLANRKEEIRGKNLSLSVAFTPQINMFLNKASIQLLVKDFQVNYLTLEIKKSPSRGERFFWEKKLRSRLACCGSGNFPDTL